MIGANMVRFVANVTTPELIWQLRDLNPAVKIIAVINSKEDYVLELLKK
jgi:hypothetical protein